MRASVVIPTKDRKDELRAAILSALKQTIPLEVIVMDDGANDGTAAVMSLEFPAIRYYCLSEGRGPAFQRNRGVELVSSEIVFSIDDDSVFASPHTVAQTLEEFDDPRVAAVGIPFINVKQDERIWQKASEKHK